MLTDRTEKRVVAFVRTVANDCHVCNRRSDENCYHCRSLWANSLMREIKLDLDGKTEEIDYSLSARIARIMLVLKTEHKPLISREIDLNGICSAQLKLWTLKYMAKKGMIIRRAIHTKTSKFYCYFLKQQKGTKTHENNSTRNGECEAR